MYNMDVCKGHRKCDQSRTTELFNQILWHKFQKMSSDNNNGRDKSPMHEQMRMDQLREDQDELFRSVFNSICVMMQQFIQNEVVRLEPNATNRL